MEANPGAKKTKNPSTKGKSMKVKERTRKW